MFALRLGGREVSTAETQRLAEKAQRISNWDSHFVKGLKAMRFHANHVSTSVAGDYYQVMFEASEDSTEPDSPYLIIQRQFEFPDGGRCYIETHDEEYIGHFRLRRVDFRPGGISVEIGRSRNNVIVVTFSITSSAFEEAEPVLKIICGEIEPEILSDEFETES